DDASQKLVARMLEARDATGQFEAAPMSGQFTAPMTGQFKDETTDAQTRVRDANVPSPAMREFSERPPTLPPLEKTGAHRVYDDQLASRQDESGAVTIAQAPPGDRTDP